MFEKENYAYPTAVEPHVAFCVLANGEGHQPNS